MVVHGFPLLSFTSLKNCMAKGMPIRVDQGRFPSLVTNIRGVVEGAQRTFCMCSQWKLIRTFSDHCSWEVCRKLWLHHRQGFCVSLQASHLHSFVIVHCDELPEPVHDTSATLFQHACRKMFNRTVAVFLLVCQELGRSDQVVANPVRRSLCSKYLCLSRSHTVLCDKNPVQSPPVILAATSRTPPVTLLLSMP